MHATVAPARSLWSNMLDATVTFLLIVSVVAFLSVGNLTGYFFISQDLVMIVLVLVLLAVCARSKSYTASSILVDPPLRLLLLAGAVLIIAGGAIGHALILHGYNMSRDEQMVMLDATTLADGNLATVLPADWLEFARALNDNFQINRLQPGTIVSDYKPVNAIFHALLLKLGLVSLTSPLLAVVGMVATWHVSARLWPDRRDLQTLTIIFYLCSTQMWANSMTTYAMSGHLALNMVWLSLFMRRDRKGYLAALFIGFLATGLHKTAFHPMFVAPFIMVLAIERKWRWTAIFGVSYIAFVVFWHRYDYVLSWSLGGGKMVKAHLDALEIASGTLRAQTVTASISNTAANIVRFVTWQHLLVVPLAFVGVRVAWRDRNFLLIAFVAACIMPFAVKLFLSAYQGHGLGYRYAHGVIGLLCLLAVAGWAVLQRIGLANARHLQLASALTIVVAAPWLLWQYSSFSSGYAQLDRKFTSLGTDIAIIDTDAVQFGRDLVFNHGDLRNRPVRLIASEIAPTQVANLCSKGTITTVPGEKLRAVADTFGQKAKTTHEFSRLVASLKQKCPQQLREFGQL